MSARVGAAIAAALLSVAGAAAARGSEPVFSPRAMAATIQLSDAAIASDGRRIAIVAERSDLPTNSYRDRLLVYDRARRQIRPLGSERSSYASPQWAPRGTRLAVIAGDHAGVDRLLLFDAASGRERWLTGGGGSVADFAWRPDGDAIAFVRRDPAASSAPGHDAFEVTDNDYLATSPSLPRHLWLVNVVRGRERRLTGGDWSVADDAISWTPNGRSIAYLRVPSAVRGISDRSSAYAFDVAAGTSRPLTPHDAHEDQALWSPDGRNLLYLYPTGGNPANALTAMVRPLGGPDERNASGTLDRHVDTAAWMPDGRSMLLKIYDVASGPLVLQPLDGPARRLPMGDVVDASISPQQSVARDGTIAFVGTQADRPNELYVLRPSASGPQRLTDFNRDVSALRLGRVQTVTWTSSDGFPEAGVLTYPPGFLPGHRYPLVLRIHGGPNETSEAAFEPFYQLAAARGYVVFAPNYRGSSNWGNGFERAIFDDASAGPARDVMEGVAAVERLNVVDPTRRCVSGWSYGGQLTSWIVGHYSGWRCAVTGAAVNDLVLDYTTADDLDAARNAFSSSPFDDGGLDAWQRQSPIRSFAAVHTPLLILGNVYDMRVPIAEQYELYRALRDRGVPVQFYAYPTRGHLPQGPVRLADAYRRWLDWFDRYLKATP